MKMMEKLGSDGGRGSSGGRFSGGRSSGGWSNETESVSSRTSAVASLPVAAGSVSVPVSRTACASEDNAFENNSPPSANSLSSVMPSIIPVAKPPTASTALRGRTKRKSSCVCKACLPRRQYLLLRAWVDVGWQTRCLNVTKSCPKHSGLGQKRREREKQQECGQVNGVKVGSTKWQQVMCGQPLFLPVFALFCFPPSTRRESDM